MPMNASAASKPSKPKIVKTTVTSNAVILKWKRTKNTTGYMIYRYSVGKYKKIKTIKRNKTVTFKNTKLKAGTKYKYYVKAYKKFGKKNIYGKRSTIKKITTKRILRNSSDGSTTPTDSNSGTKVPNIYINYRGEDENKTTKITLGQAWNNSLKNSIGSCDFVADRDCYTTYVYDTNCDDNKGDFSSYLEIFVGKKTNYTTKENKVIGWLTNQPGIAFYDDVSIKTGTSVNLYKSLSSKYLNNGFVTEETPLLSLNTKYNMNYDEHGNADSTNSNATDSVLWGSVYTSDYKYDRQATDENTEEVMAENYTNMIRKCYNQRLYIHDNKIYSGSGGAKMSAQDWAAYGTVKYKSTGHTTSGILNAVLKDKSYSNRRDMVKNDNGGRGYAENAHSNLQKNEIAESCIIAFYNSTGHRNTMLSSPSVLNYSIPITNMAIGVSYSEKASAWSQWFGLSLSE